MEIMKINSKDQKNIHKNVGQLCEIFDALLTENFWYYKCSWAFQEML